MGFIEGNRDQLGFIAYSLDDFVEEDSKARFIVRIVEELDLSLLYEQYSPQGGEAFCPKAMLATLFFGYSQGISVTRDLEYNCKKNMDFIYVSANLRPDHTSLSRFRKRHLAHIPGLFIQIVRKAIEMGISEFMEIAMDGSKMAAASSKKKSMRSNKIEEKLKAIKEDITEYLNQSEIEEEKLAELEKKKAKLEEAQRILEERKETIKENCRDNHQVNIEEPEAPMQKPGGGKSAFPGYNPQICTDTKTQFIANAQLTPDRNDEKQFMLQYNNTERILGPNKKRRYLSDGGFNTNDTIFEIYYNQIDAYVGNRRNGKETSEKIKKGLKFDKSDFTYDKEKDIYICPSDKKLEFKKTEKNKSFKGRKYVCNDCGNCEFRSQCLSKNNKSGKREIRRDDREIYVEMMREKVETEEGKEKLLIRSTTVEPVFGNIKWNLGYTRFRLKGLFAANAEFLLMCIGHNLNKLFKLFGKVDNSPDSMEVASCFPNIFNYKNILPNKLQVLFR